MGHGVRTLLALAMSVGLLSSSASPAAGAMRTQVSAASVWSLSVSEHEPNGSFATATSAGDISSEVVVTGTLNEMTDRHDLYRVFVNAGETIGADVTGDPPNSTNFRVQIFGPGARDFSSPIAVAATGVYPNGTAGYAPISGYYYVDITTSPAYSGGSGSYGASIYICGQPTVMSAGCSATVSYGATATIHGRVKASRGWPPLGVVRAYSSQDGTNWAEAGVWMMDDSLSGTGVFSFETPPARSTTLYRMDFEGYPGLFGPSSATIKVAAPARLPAPHVHRIAGGRLYRVVGVLEPLHPAGSKPVRVYAWRYEDRRWRLFGHMDVAVSNRGNSSAYMASLHLPLGGAWRFQAYHMDAQHLATRSAYTYVLPTKSARGTRLAKRF